MKKEYRFTFWTDKESYPIFKEMMDKVLDGTYKFKDWDSFVEASLLAFTKMLDNGIPPYLFDEFINTYKSNREESTKIDA